MEDLEEALGKNRDSDKTETVSETVEREESVVEESKDQWEKEKYEELAVLNQRIDEQKFLVMKCLESSSAPIDELRNELDKQITVLQELQRQQIEYEVTLTREDEEAKLQKDNGTEGNWCTIPEYEVSSESYKRDHQEELAERRSQSANVARDNNTYSTVYLTVNIGFEQKNKLNFQK